VKVETTVIILPNALRALFATRDLSCSWIRFRVQGGLSANQERSGNGHLGSNVSRAVEESKSRSKASIRACQCSFSCLTF
jgi:hypothetical protein